MDNVVTSLAAASISSGHARAIDPSNCYKMDHKKRGKCIIFNNKEFAKSTKMPAREGSDFDALNMREIFGDLLLFDVDIHDNRTTIEMLQIVAKGKTNASDILAANFNGLLRFLRLGRTSKISKTWSDVSMHTTVP